jgi:hypothetical protein
MNITNVGTYLTNRIKFNFQQHVIEGVEFDLIPLTEDMILELQIEQETYADKLEYAAKYGVSIERNRVCDDALMAEELKGMWELEQFSECEPSLIHKVGLMVCEISGLTEFVEAQKDREDAVNGDLDTPDITLDELNQHKAVA